jgi:hypothetical protein
MEESPKIQSRNKFLKLGLAATAVIATFRFFKPVKKEVEAPKKVKFLTQDGRLVEVDTKNLLCEKNVKVSDEELKNWVRR